MPLSVSTGVGIGASQRAEGVSVDFPLTLVGSGAQFYMRPDPGHVTASGGSVSQADDRSGLSRHATQTGLSSIKPILIESWRNGRPALSFDGGDRMSIPSSLLTVDDWSIAMVYECTSLTAARCVARIGASGHVGYVLNDSGNGTRGVRVNGVGVASDGAAVTTPEAVIISRQAGVLHIYLAGGEVTNSSPNMAPTAPSGNSSIGSLLDSSSTFPFVGNLAELLVYQASGGGALSAGQRSSYFSYAAQRYSL